MTERELLRRTAEVAADHLDTLDARPVYPSRTVDELRARSCARARQFAAQITELTGCEVLNDVVLNQVLFRFPDDEATTRALAAVQASGEAWMSGTVWDDRAAIRLSVSSWRTTEQDIDRTVAAFSAALG